MLKWTIILKCLVIRKNLFIRIIIVLNVEKTSEMLKYLNSRMAHLILQHVTEGLNLLSLSIPPTS